MALSFKIPPSAYDGLTALIEIGPDRLSLLAQEARKKRLTLDVGRLTTELAKETQSDVDQLETAIDSILVPLSGLRADFRMTGEDFVRLLTELIEDQNGEWFKANGPGWDRVAHSVGDLIGPDSIFGQVTKAYRLLANRPAAVDEFKLLTELRPVYDDEVTAVKGYLVNSTLAVSYQEFGESKRVHLAVDYKDLERLREQIERGLKKIQLLEQQVALLEVPSLVPGTERS